MLQFGVKTGTFVSFLIILAAYFYKRQTGDVLRNRLNNVLHGLLRAESQVELGFEPKVAVGFGACLDVIGDAVEVLDKLGARSPDFPEHFNELESLEDLEKVFAYFFRHGAAAERYIKNATVFMSLVQATRDVNNSIEKLGGNAPMMATRFHMEGCKVLLGGKLSPQLQKQIAPNILVSGGEVETDDIHVALEYKKGDVWGNYVTPRSNRFFFHNDHNNPFLTSLEQFSQDVALFAPALLVIGGLQMLDNFPFTAGTRRSRLRKLHNLLASTPRETRIHFEMASFAEQECLEDVVDTVVHHVDSLGMNEQELPNLHGVLTNGSITLISDTYPRIATTLDHMRAVYRILSKPTDGHHGLTRLHVHTLAYQAIMTAKSSSWKHSMSAAAKAALTANRYTCGSDYIETEKARILMDQSFSTSHIQGSKRIHFEPDNPVSCWDEPGVEICIAPVLVCTKVVQTGGGGDNVSSAGLVLQI
ncbi:putative ADP-dependent glucokinase [Lamellibrachia satsuma]|nr:putative ADP-dependent glucokinase [Lamellibrachia satsuma]